MNQREPNALLAGGQLMLACQAKHEAAPVSSYDRENGQGEMHHEAGAHAARVNWVNDFKVQCNYYIVTPGIPNMVLGVRKQREKSHSCCTQRGRKVIQDSGKSDQKHVSNSFKQFASGAGWIVFQRVCASARYATRPRHARSQSRPRRRSLSLPGEDGGYPARPSLPPCAAWKVT